MMKRTTKARSKKRMASGGVIDAMFGPIISPIMDYFAEKLAVAQIDEQEKRKQNDMAGSLSAPKAMKKGGAVRGCGAAVRGMTRGSVR